MRELVGALIAGVIGLAWGSLVFRRYQGVVAVEQGSAQAFSTVSSTLFNA